MPANRTIKRATADPLDELHREVRGCTICRAHLPLSPRPIAQFSATSRVLIIGQAPGRITHESGIAFDDKSGDRLAEWLGIEAETLHDPRQIAIVSMGLCYPGKATGGDKPPRPECAPTWHPRIMSELPDIGLTLLVGIHAQKYYLPRTRGWTMVQRIRHANGFTSKIPLPHPSWRSALFMRANPWFERATLPLLQHRVRAALGEDRT